MKPKLLALIALLAPGLASAVITHRWTLNETSLAADGTGVLESVSNTTVGQLFGTATGVVGNPGVYPGDLSYLFSGNAANNGGNAVATKFNNVLPTTGDFSVFVTAVFATNYQGGGRMLLSNNNSQAGRVDFGIAGTTTIPNQLTFFLGGASAMTIAFTDSAADPVLFDGGFHEVGVTRAGSSFQLHVDGVAVGSAGTSSVAISTNTEYRIGRRNAFSGFFNNAISEVQVFNEVRSSGLAVIPEPSTAVLGMGGIGLALLARRRTR
jgi:hypothetical protein